MYVPLRRILWLSAGAAWLLVTAFGFAQLWTEQGAGAAAQAPIVLPHSVNVIAHSGQPTLVMLIHPQCPCSRASIGELASLMAHCQGKLSATVLMIRPAGAPEGWEKTDLWRSAAEIPGVTVIADPQGSASRRFGAATSGQTLLYSGDGRLLFSGGITESRGHSGDNAGRSLIVSLVQHEIAVPQGDAAHTPVYGCPLFSASSP